MEKLVSILTPCYNGSKYIERYAKSLLEQNYSNCQIIFMDDGSTDNTKDLIFSYKELFEKKGFLFEYHYHDNIGVGGTIAKGVKYIKGEYFVWPDIDDILTPDSISKKVMFLEQRLELGVVRTRYRKLFEDNNNDMSQLGPTFKFDKTKEYLFEDYLLSKNCWLQPGCFMIRTSAFDDANPERYIFPTRRGQNWQILLPILYKYKCGYIDEPLYIYAIHPGSMSDVSKDTLEIIIKRYEMYEELIVETVKHMRINEENKYIDMVHNRYLHEKFASALNYSNKEIAKFYYNELKKRNALNLKSLIKYYLVYMPQIYYFIRKIRKI